MSGDDPVDPVDPVDPDVARLLADPAVWAEVPADLRARTLAAAIAAGPPAAADPTASGAAPAAPGDLAARAAPGGSVADFGRRAGPRFAGGRSTRHGWPRRVLLAAAAVVLLGLVAVGGLRLARGSQPGGTQVALAGTGQAPGVSATAHLRDEPAGVSVELDVSDLPPAPKGTFYEAWLVGESGKVSAGTFHRRGDQDTVKLWLGVDPAGYDALTVTRQPVDGGTTAPGVVLLRGELAGRAP